MQHVAQIQIHMEIQLQLQLHIEIHTQIEIQIHLQLQLEQVTFGVINARNPDLRSHHKKKQVRSAQVGSD